MKNSGKVRQAYHGGAFFSAIGEDFKNLKKSDQVISADVLDAWFDPSPKVISKLKQHLAFTLRTSPPTHSEGLVKVISRVRRIPEENLLVGGGSSDLMFILFPHLLRKNDKVMILDPMYGEYSHIFSHVVQVKLSRYMLSENQSFRIDFVQLVRDIRRIKPRMVVLVNPNSPTGQHHSKAELVKFMNAVPPSVLVVIDEAYIDYVGANQSMETMTPKYKNLLVIKSMSKVYSLSGARVAYLAGSKKIINDIAKFFPPWPVSLPAQIAGIEALQDYKYYQKCYKQTHKLRRAMIAQLQDVPGIKIYDSVANYFLINLGGRWSAEHLVTQLRRDNIFIRNCNSMSQQFNDNFVRIAIKDGKTNRKIVQALKNALA